MNKLEKEVIVLTLIHEMIIKNCDIHELSRPSGITITMRGLIVFLEVNGYTEQAKTLKTTFCDYLGEEVAMNLEIMDFEKELVHAYPRPIIVNVLSVAIREVDGSYIANFIHSFPHRRNDVERAIRTAFVDKFVEKVGCIKTMAKYIRIDISRKIYNVTWDTVHDKQGFTDAIIKYKMLTELENKSANPTLPSEPFAIKIPELGLSLDINIV